MTNEQIIEKINAMTKGQWFTSQDITGKPNARVGQMLYQMSESECSHEGHTLLNAAGMRDARKYMWAVVK